MKISRRDALSGPVRWLMRIGGWSVLVSGIFTAIFPTDSPYPYAFGGSPLLFGAFLVILDLLLPDPVRKARRMRKKLEKLYNAVYNALPSNAAAFDLAKRTSGLPNLDMQIQLYSYSAKALFQEAPVKETLFYIYRLNPQAGYEICVDLVQAAKNQASKNQPTRK